tara:strand:+ start:1684 stop:2022 length:339 start_codon:yes stop_codon:yes gene_type:complete
MSKSKEVDEKLAMKIDKKVIDISRIAMSRLAKRNEFMPNHIFCMVMIRMFEMTRMVDKEICNELFASLVHNLHKKKVLFEKMDISDDILDMLSSDDHVCKDCQKEMESQTKH